jgi:hypothetical protein
MPEGLTPTILPAEDPRQPEMASTQIQRMSNTGNALAAREQAQTQARYIVALQRPRDWDTVRVLMLKECARPAFAAGALYQKPIGGNKTVEGFSIRFAEALQRNISNISTDTVVDDEDENVIKLRVITTDLESNTSWSTGVTVRKTIERRKVREGQTVLSTRRNEVGDIVYLIEASDDEILVKQNALVSKAARNNIVRLCPGDIQDDCEAKIKAVVASKTKEDPDGERKKILDFFGTVGVLPDELKAYLGHDLGPGQVSVEELDDLRKVYTALKERETSWAKVMQEKAEALGKPASSAPAAKDAAEAVRQKLERK